MSSGILGRPRCPIEYSACIWSRSGNGCVPVIISITRQPRLHTSPLTVYFVSLTTSGAIQNTDPCSDARRSILLAATTSSTRFEMPKSEILTLPS
ncbi:hypothetical protein GGF38_003758 [Coemansia sp. RSA 25]|nr:hypothetical protein GGF38_003758 [Coemansia sp. RSA 25]